MKKNDLRELLERRTKVFEEVYGGQVETLAEVEAPERKAWRKRPSLLDKSFQEDIRKEEKRQAEIMTKTDDVYEMDTSLFPSY